VGFDLVSHSIFAALVFVVIVDVVIVFELIASSCENPHRRRTLSPKSVTPTRACLRGGDKIKSWLSRHETRKNFQSMHHVHLNDSSCPDQQLISEPNTQAPVAVGVNHMHHRGGRRNCPPSSAPQRRLFKRKKHSRLIIKNGAGGSTRPGI